MILKTAIAKTTFAAAFCAGLLGWAALSVAAEPQPGQYRPNDFLGLDLPTAVLSPKPLGPPAQFAPFPIRDASGDSNQQARAEPNAVQEKTAPGMSIPGKPVPERVVADKADVGRVTANAGNPDAELYARSARAAVRVAKPRGASRVKLARQHHGNPLDAQASDTRVQVWPCKSGGICNWQRQ